METVKEIPQRETLFNLATGSSKLSTRSGKEFKGITREPLKKLEKWLNQSSRELKTTSAYLLEHQVEVNSSQLFDAYYRNVLKDRAEIIKTHHHAEWNLSSSMEDQT